jgi:AcrR family transcriptional regulator
MENKKDLRVVRTRKMLKDAFISLLAEIGFQKITVDNLTQRAFVSRNTFYLHYTDKYEMLDRLVDEVLHNLSEFALEAPIGESAPMMSRFVLRIIAYISENQEIFLLLSGKNGDMKFYKKLQDTIRPVITQRGFIARLRIPEDYSVALISGISTSIIGEWLASGLKETPEELSQIMGTIISVVSMGLLSEE